MKIAGVDIKAVPLSQCVLNNLIKNIYPSTYQFHLCPLCGGTIKNYVYSFQISDVECIKINGKACYKCDAFFMATPKLINELEKCNTYKQKKVYQIHHSLENVPEFPQHKPSSFGYIVLTSPDEIRKYEIVEKNRDSNSPDNILHVINHDALELLTAIIEKRTKVVVNGKEFIIDDVPKKWIASGIRIFSKLEYVELEIKHNGGYFEDDEDIINLIALLFCERSQRLEYITISYDKNKRIYYVDPQILHNFIKTHGIPLIRLWREGSDNIQKQSVLNFYGYNVNANENISSENRHAKLCAIIDNRIMDVHEVVNLLQLKSCRAHSTQKHL